MRTLVMTAALMFPGAAFAQASVQAETGQPPQRIRSVTLAAGERCPPSTGDEVVVCYQGGNPYRIPPGLRESAPTAANHCPKPSMSCARRANHRRAERDPPPRCAIRAGAASARPPPRKHERATVPSDPSSTDDNAALATAGGTLAVRALSRPRRVHRVCVCVCVRACACN